MWRSVWLLALLGCPPSQQEVLDLYDEDGDGYYVAEASAQGEEGPFDCDDADGAVHPGAAESCNGVDDDCDSEIDEGAAEEVTWYADADADGYGDPASTRVQCEQPPGYVAEGTDCDDADPSMNPGSKWHRDDDGDGYGAVPVEADATGCVPPSPEHVLDGTDCKDSNAAMYPGADEVCDDVDNDCDGTVDEGLKDTYYRDEDGDSHGDPDAPMDACETPTGYAALGDDCDDDEPTVYRGAPEYCDGLDNDCNAQVDDEARDEPIWYVDSDADGYGTSKGVMVTCDQPPGYVDNADDCDDTRASVSPGQVENSSGECSDGLDNDCDVLVDEFDASCP